MNMSFWNKVKDYFGISLTKVKDAVKDIEVGPPSAPDFQDVVGGDLVKKAKTKPAAKKTSAKKK